MNFDFFLQRFLVRLVRNLPALIALVLCAAMMLSQWRRHPRSAFRAALAFGWFLFADLLALFWYTIGIRLLEAEFGHDQEVESYSETVLSCLEAVGYVLVVLALNAARVPYRPPE